jgi:hypothetical protein
MDGLENQREGHSMVGSFDGSTLYRVTLPPEAEKSFKDALQRPIKDKFE